MLLTIAINYFSFFERKVGLGEDFAGSFLFRAFSRNGGRKLDTIPRASTEIVIAAVRSICDHFLG
jgi:hypothetical protein